MRYVVSRVDDWQPVAEAIQQRLEPGTLVLVRGPLGAGKTTLVQTLAKALGVKKVPKSPTFSLLRTYPVPGKTIQRLVHIDAYRLEGGEDVRALGLDELWHEPGTVTVIEWPEHLGRYLDTFPGKRLELFIEPEGRDGVRRVRLQD